MSIFKAYKASRPLFTNITRTKNGYAITIEGQPDDTENFIIELENNSIL